MTGDRTGGPSHGRRRAAEYLSTLDWSSIPVRTPVRRTIPRRHDLQPDHALRMGMPVVQQNITVVPERLGCSLFLVTTPSSAAPWRHMTLRDSAGGESAQLAHLLGTEYRRC